ncbi:unnamed protein product [Ceratitis capitata]|uniref:(Mediterranean fruit fly) hypothetical protein n=1 Tax=Ceratitis capitata TaxID=7213 RepID=A0A811UMQ9_CERCA|nr:unnamed protein product [Ceratitis capitata]
MFTACIYTYILTHTNISYLQTNKLRQHQHLEAFPPTMQRDATPRSTLIVAEPFAVYLFRLLVSLLLLCGCYYYKSFKADIVLPVLRANFAPVCGQNTLLTISVEGSGQKPQEREASKAMREMRTIGQLSYSHDFLPLLVGVTDECIHQQAICWQQNYNTLLPLNAAEDVSN